MRNALLAFLIMLAAGGAWRPARGETPARGRVQAGLASWYSGGGTACGDRTVQPFTAAHRSLPCGAVVRVTVIARARQRPDADPRGVVVTIRDRGPFVRGRIVDLDPVSARALGLIGPGVRPVTLERLR